MNNKWYGVPNTYTSEKRRDIVMDAICFDLITYQRIELPNKLADAYQFDLSILRSFNPQRIFFAESQYDLVLQLANYLSGEQIGELEAAIQHKFQKLEWDEKDLVPNPKS